MAYARLGAAGIDAYDNLLARRDGGSWDVTTMMTTVAAAATDVMLYYLYYLLLLVFLNGYKKIKSFSPPSSI